MGAVLGQLTNIDELGQASMGFHGDPAIMQHDPYRYGLESRIISHLHIRTGGASLLFVVLLRLPGCLQLPCYDPT